MSPHGMLPEWRAVLAHELRSPVAAILGYEELLEDGTFGDMSPAALDALRRIRQAAEQLISLIEGLEHAAGDTAETVSARELVDAALEAVRFDADARNVRITTAADDGTFVTRRAQALRALVLALGAAIKTSPEASLEVRTDAGASRITIAGSRLDPARDDTGPDAPLTGAGLRLQLARAVAAGAAGSILLDGSGTLHLDLPRLDPRSHPD